MATTAFIVGFLFVSHFIQWVAWGVCLALGLKWAGADNITRGGVATTTVVTHVGQTALLLLLALCLYLGRSLPISALVLLAASGLLAVALIPILLVRSIFQITFWRSIQALLPTLLVLAMGYASIAGVVRPFVGHSFAPAQELVLSAFVRH